VAYIATPRLAAAAMPNTAANRAREPPPTHRVLSNRIAGGNST